jgi:hypothetical protein
MPEKAHGLEAHVDGGLWRNGCSAAKFGCLKPNA